MACNCKRVNKLQDEYGVKEEETVMETISRKGMKVLLFVITLGLATVMVPVIFVMAVWSIFFKDGQITLPNFIGKYMRDDGKKL